MKVDYSEAEAIRFHSITRINSYVLYTDGSVRNSLYSVTVVKGFYPYQHIRTATIGFEKHCSILTTEAVALTYAVRHVHETIMKAHQPIIFTDAKAVLNQVAKGEKGGIEAKVFVTLIDLLREVT